MAIANIRARREEIQSPMPSKVVKEIVKPLPPVVRPIERPKSIGVDIVKPPIEVKRIDPPMIRELVKPAEISLAVEQPNDMGVLKKILKGAKNVVGDIAKVAINTIVPAVDPFKPASFKTGLGKAVNQGAKVFDNVANSFIKNTTGLDVQGLVNNFKPALSTGGTITGQSSAVSAEMVNDKGPSLFSKMLESKGVVDKLTQVKAEAQTFAKNTLEDLTGQGGSKEDVKPWYKTTGGIIGIVTGVLIVLGTLFKLFVSKKR